MRRTRTSEEIHDAAIDAAVHALSDARIDARLDGSMLRYDLDGNRGTLRVLALAYVTAERARELVAVDDTGDRVLLVADKITADARRVLTDASWSWLDLRGRLHVHAPGVRVDLDVQVGSERPIRTSSSTPIAGRSGLTVAYWLCEHPGSALSPTGSAPTLGMAPSTISTAVRRLADAGLVDRDGTGVFPELFWELAAAWAPERVWLTAVPDQRRRSPDPAEPGWRRTGTAAAVAYGAPVVATPGGPVELYVVGPVEISIAVRECGTARPGLGAAAVMVPPVTAVNAPAPERPVVDGWTVAPPLAVALDLAQDRARGREILEEWEVPGAVWR